MRGSGGTEGGLPQFCIGLALSVAGAWFFFDSVRVWTEPMGGLVSGMFNRAGVPGGWQTASMGIIFAPFFIGVICLFYDARQTWAWGLAIAGVLILVVEILSRIRFHLDMKTTYLLLQLGMIAAGAGLMLRSYREYPGTPEPPSENLPKEKTPNEKMPGENPPRVP